MLTLAPDQLRGSIPPLVTPFKNGAVDYDAYAGLVEFQAKEGSHGILVNGTTSEPASLTVEERNKIVDVAVEAAAGRLTVVAATGSQSYAETEALTRHAAAKDGVDALLIVTPYYSRPPQRGLVEYYRRLNELHNKPWMIYHIPGRAAVDVKVETAVEIDKVCPTFVGMKHASLDLGYVSDLFEAISPDLRIFVGLEELSFPMMAVGACGLMNAVGNLRPKPLAEMCEAVWAGDLNKGRELHHQLFEINKAVFYDINPIPMKYMMKRLGIMPENEHRIPLMPATPEIEKKLDGVLKHTGLI
ncbi:4-hydroxy-tetrahydrodipicolinate synthase [Cucumibacter marinus]|uniref:4-hydroxy-tetrahydrodipicolinate synthase n=1 Tax=Cucumibacter marinus TaxID=1121252 RepID=UPI0003F77ED8|nr:4-hydroxy-tetrahydrodipicolinate synthase [Cucumibacter marinus]